MHQVGD